MESTSVIAVDYVGEPGKRAFFLQSRTEGETQTFEIEKQQVSVLAEKLREMLLLVDATDQVSAATPARNASLALIPPLDAVWRIGTIGLAYDDEEDFVIVVLQAVAEAGEEASEDETVRLNLKREQVREFIVHAEAIVGEGRPICQLCGLSMDPSSHACPASNGHRLSS